MFKELKFIHITKTAGTSIEDSAHKNGIYWGRFHKEYADMWHRPFIEIDNKVKQKYDWFTIVRNPYERIISEFYCKWVAPYKNQNTFSQAEFNDITQKNILKSKTNPIALGFHYVPQYQYIDNRHKIHVLKFEELPNNFHKLMLKYNLNIKLNVRENVGENKIFNIKHLNKKTLELINMFYGLDFILFNYPKI
jgi:hypothetical protein